MAKTTSDVKKAVASKGYDNGGAYINPNSLKIPPSTVQKLAGDTNVNLGAASGLLMERFNDYRYYSGDTSS
jgi:hypothetical protein